MNDNILNEKIERGLRAQFSEQRTNEIIQQAFSTFHFHNPQSPNSPELYEVFEGGYVDQALETLGFGCWAIGRPKFNGNGKPKPRLGVFRNNTPAPGPENGRALSVANSEPTQPEPDAVDLFLAHIPTPDETRRPFSEFANAIEYRNILVVGDQGAGKTTLCESLAEGLEQKWGDYAVHSWIQHSGVDRLLAYGTRGIQFEEPQAWFLVGEDLTLVKIPPQHINWFFKVRHLVYRNSRVRRGLVVTSFNTHTLFGVDKNLRTRFTMMLLKSVPTNPYDRSLLKKYFDESLLDRFERIATDSDVLVWDRFHTKGVWGKVPLPTENLLQEVPEGLKDPLKWDLVWVKAILALFVAILAWALYNFIQVGLRVLSHA